HAVVSTSAALLADADLSDVNRRVVIGYAKRCFRIFPQPGPHGFTAEIHEGCRLDQGHVLLPDGAEFGDAAMPALPGGSVVGLGEQVQQPPADIVARPGVARTGVAET